MTRTRTRTFGFVPGLSLSVTGAAGVIAHFESEYGRSAVDDDAANIVLRVGEGDGGGLATRDVLLEPRADAHRWLRWQVALSPGSRTGLTAAIRITGRPRSVALSLVQGYVVEPLVSLIAPSVGHVLVPAAAIATPRGLVLILGPSGAGKSTLSARALARGIQVLGDDQVFVDAAGLCHPLPRRIRVYPDLRLTAPEAFLRLSRASRARLGMHAFLGRATRGRLRPSLAVDRSALGATSDPVAAPIARVILVDARAPAVALRIERASAGDAIAEVEHLLRAQRSRLGRVAPPEWHLVAEAVARQELGIVADAVRGIEITRVRIPRAWPATRAIDGLARAIDAEAVTAESRRARRVASPDAVERSTDRVVT